ncbi:MAG: carotenoid biosynthesis protein [Promethearchaeota archaeon]
MTNWILVFEIPVVLFFLFAVEYLNIAISDGYHYHTDFLLQFGNPPTNVPIVIGLAWGMLLMTAQDVSQRLKLPLRVRIFFEAAFVVSMDIILDVVAIRLEGGFWVWDNVTTDLTITNSSLFDHGCGKSQKF